MPSARKPYPSDVSHEERASVAPYLSLLPLNAPQRRRNLHEAFNGLPFIVKTGAHWPPVATQLSALGDRLPGDPALVQSGVIGERGRIYNMFSRFGGAYQ